MRRAATLSAFLHVTVVVFVFFGVPSLFRPDREPEQPVSVDLVVFEPEATRPEPPEPKPEPEPEPEPEAKAPPKPAPSVPPPPPPMAELPEPVPVPAPAPAPEPKPKPKPKVQEKPKPKAPQVTKRVPRPKAKPKPPPDRFQTLLRNLAKQSRQQRSAEKRKTEPVKKDPQVAAAVPTSVDRRRIAAGLAQMVERQIRECWNIPGGAKDAAEMRIEIRIRLNPDGTLRGAPVVVDSRRMQSEPVFRTVAESALRALRNPRCSPLKLPYAQYDIWKDIALNFDPREALGQ